MSDMFTKKDENAIGGFVTGMGAMVTIIMVLLVLSALGVLFAVVMNLCLKAFTGLDQVDRHRRSIFFGGVSLFALILVAVNVGSGTPLLYGIVAAGGFVMVWSLYHIVALSRRRLAALVGGVGGPVYGENDWRGMNRGAMPYAISGLVLGLIACSVYDARRIAAEKVEQQVREDRYAQQAAEQRAKELHQVAATKKAAEQMATHQQQVAARRPELLAQIQGLQMSAELPILDGDFYILLGFSSEQKREANKHLESLVASDLIDRTKQALGNGSTAEIDSPFGANCMDPPGKNKLAKPVRCSTKVSGKTQDGIGFSFEVKAEYRLASRSGAVGIGATSIKVIEERIKIQ